MKFVVGLGNPGAEYENTLHNIGFRCLDVLAKDIGCDAFVAKFHASVCKGVLEGNAYMLLKPQTFMNLSGTSVAAAVRFYKARPEDVIAVFDDLDIPPGTIRYRQSGGAGGHKGVSDIAGKLGDTAFHRLKIGIGRPNRNQPVNAFVLSSGNASNRDSVENAAKRASQYLTDFICDRIIHINGSI